MLDQQFYLDYCKSAGVRPGRGDITQPAVKLGPSEMTKDCYYKDEELKQMDIRLADMSYYHGKGDELVDHITKECFIKKIYI